MAVKVLIVDDDPIAGGLSRDLLTDSGYEVDLLTDSIEAIDTLKRNGYGLVILDILMPGIDGLTLCHKIKHDPKISHIKVVMVSGKSFKAEKQRAKQYGADLFIEKPYSVDTFVSQIGEVAGRIAAPAARQDAPPAQVVEGNLASADPAVLKLRVWGCRSAADAPSAEPSLYGRKTSCVSVESGDNLFIFDAGSSLIDLGEEIIREGRHKLLWLFLTHFHRDHVEGLGKFPCALTPGYTLRLSGAPEPDKGFQELVKEAFQHSMGSKPIQAKIELYQLIEQTYEILPGVRLSAFYANHPGATLGYSLETQGRKLVYCPDSELYGESATAMQDYDEKLGKICAGADLLVHDARYTAEDYQTMRNNGHSSFASAVDFAGRNEVKRLILFHHDNQYADSALSRMAEEAARLISEKGYSLQCAMAREGLTVGI